LAAPRSDRARFSSSTAVLSPGPCVLGLRAAAPVRRGVAPVRRRCFPGPVRAPSDGLSDAGAIAKAPPIKCERPDVTASEIAHQYGAVSLGTTAVGSGLWLSAGQETAAWVPGNRRRGDVHPGTFHPLRGDAQNRRPPSHDRTDQSRCGSRPDRSRRLNEGCWLGLFDTF